MNIMIALAFAGPILLIGCTTTIEKGNIVDGKYIATNFIRVKGIGKGEFPDGTKAEGRPVIEMPKLEFDN